MGYLRAVTDRCCSFTLMFLSPPSLSSYLSVESMKCKSDEDLKINSTLVQQSPSTITQMQGLSSFCGIYFIFINLKVLFVFGARLMYPSIWSFHPYILFLWDVPVLFPRNHKVRIALTKLIRILCSYLMHSPQQISPLPPNCPFYRQFFQKDPYMTLGCCVSSFSFRLFFFFNPE